MLSGGSFFVALVGRTRVFLPGGVGCCSRSGFFPRQRRPTTSFSLATALGNPDSLSSAASAAHWCAAFALHPSAFFDSSFKSGGKKTFSSSSSSSSSSRDGAGDHYATLGLTRSATPKEIKAAFYRLSKQFHPDVNPGDRKAEDKFKAVSAAYNVLGDAVRKRDYDRETASSAGKTSYSTDGRWPGTSDGGFSSRESADWSYQDMERLKREQEVVWRTLREMDAKYGQRHANDFGFGHFKRTARPGSQSPPAQEAQKQYEARQQERARKRAYEDYQQFRDRWYGTSRRGFDWRKMNLAQLMVLSFMIGLVLNLIISVVAPPDLHSPYQRPYDGRRPPD